MAGLFTYTTVHAQKNNQPKISLGADFGFPVGNFSNVINYAVGGSLLYQNPITERFELTGNVGYLRLNGKERNIINIKYSEGFIPIKAGARYFLLENFYAAAELGASISTASGSGSGTSFVYAPALGVEFPVSDTGAVDVGLRYESWSRSNGTRSFIGIRAGYNF